MNRPTMPSLLFVAFTASTPSLSANLGDDCAPSGVFNIAREAVSPISFWKSVIVEIDEDIKSFYAFKRGQQLQAQQDRAQAAIEAREYREIEREFGVKQEPIPPELYRLEAEAARGNAAFDSRMMQRWTKCRAYASQKLSQLKQ